MQVVGVQRVDVLPSEIPHLESFCKALLTVEVEKRLGVGADGFAALKSHSFFNGLEWGQLAAGQLEAPIKPSSSQMNAPLTMDMDMKKVKEWEGKK